MGAIDGLGARLREARQRSGLTQAQVAKQLNCHAHVISYWETAEREPSLDRLAVLAKLYQVRTDQLLGLETIPLTVATAYAFLSPDERMQVERFAAFLRWDGSGLTPRGATTHTR